VTGLVLDAGALIAFERNDRAMVALVARVHALRGRLIVPAAVVGQVWRDGGKQVRLARLLASPITIVESLTDARARAAGQLCGAVGTRDVVDASVVMAARAHETPIASSDPDDLRRLDAKVRIVRV
jgi:hypothetical protein